MAVSNKDSLYDLDRHRERLEANIAKLRSALQHWQTWEVEYEGLKEEISALGKNATHEDIVAVGENFGGSVLDEKEISSILGADSKTQRSSTQVAGVLSRRIDYVQQNVQTIEKQLRSTEDKLASVLNVKHPQAENEQGFPMLEIREELDDHGNVISSSRSAARDEAPKLLEALEQAGVKETASKPTQHVSASKQKTLSFGSSSLLNQDSNNKGQEGAALIPPKTHITTRATPSLPNTKKEVRSAPDSNINVATSDESPSNSVQAKENFAKREAGSEKVEEGKEERPAPVIPSNESPEDSALRRDMLDYGLSEAGAVVAQLDLDDQFVFPDDDDYTDEEELSVSSAEDEVEDKFGRTTRRVVTDEYRKEMEALEKKLNARTMQNVGPNLGEPSAEDPIAEAQHVAEGNDGSSTSKKARSIKKGVRFADEVDISSNTPDGTSAKATGTLESPPSSEPPMRDSIIERKTPDASVPTASSTSKSPPKLSQFKSMRAAGASPGTNATTISDHVKRTSPPPASPATSPPTVLSSAIVERPQNSSSTASPQNSGDMQFDPTLQRREVASEYYAQRNRRIQSERGGFVPQQADTEAEIEARGGMVPLAEDEIEYEDERDRPPAKKVSLFRAARLARGTGMDG